MSENKTVIIIEDSSKSKFGGGQKISNCVMEELHMHHDIYLADIYQPNLTLFQEKALPLIKGKIKLKGYGKIISGKAPYDLGFKEIFFFPFYLAHAVAKTANFIRRRNTKNVVMYAATKKALTYAYFVNLLTACPYIFHMHSAESSNPLIKFFMKIMYRRAIKVICVSNFIANQQNLHNKIVVYNPVSATDKQMPKTIAQKETITVATFSTLLKGKGIDVFIDSYTYLFPINRNIVYKIYGEGPEYDYLSSKALGNSNIRMMGFVDDVNKAMKEIDLLVIPSVMEESFGMSAAEAMILGIPAIVTNIGGQKEIVSDGISGLHIPPMDPRSLGEAIGKLIDDPDMYNRCSIGACQRSEQFSLLTFSKNINKIFNNDI